MLRSFLFIGFIVIFSTLSGCTNIDYAKLENDNKNIIEEITTLRYQLDGVNLELENLKNERAELKEVIKQLELQMEERKTDITDIELKLESIVENQTVEAEGQVAVSGKITTPTYSSSLITSDVIESKIDGDFEGWEGDTVFKLTNGQVWMQESFSFTYHYAFMPNVLIYKTGNRYKMSVEGVSKTIYVQRIK